MGCGSSNSLLRNQKDQVALSGEANILGTPTCQEKKHSNPLALHSACKCEDYYEKVTKLVEARADLEACDGNGYTPLALAAVLGKWQVVLLLQDNGACTDVQDLSIEAGQVEGICFDLEECVKRNVTRSALTSLRMSAGGVVSTRKQFQQLPSPHECNQLLHSPEARAALSFLASSIGDEASSDILVHACLRQAATEFLIYLAGHPEIQGQIEDGPFVSTTLQIHGRMNTRKGYYRSEDLEFNVTQASRWTKIALLYAHTVGAHETEEYKCALEYYKKIMKLPADWDLEAVESLVIRGQTCDGVTQGRSHPAAFFMQEVDNISGFQQLFEACSRRVYTRDRSGECVPASLSVQKVFKCMNDQVFAQYGRHRETVQSHLSGLKKAASYRSTYGIEGEFTEDVTAADLATTRHLREVDHGLDPSLVGIDLDGCNECWLFHGTSAEAAQIIAKDDFRLSLAGSSAGTLYGRGIYLAQNPEKADEYCSADSDGLFTMLLCRATLGWIYYTADLNPNVDQIERECQTGRNFGRRIRFQSLLGDREKCRGTFKEIVVYNDDNVYPEFILKYRRNFND